MYNFSSTKDYGNFCFIATLQKTLHMLKFKLVIMFIYLRSNFDFFYLNNRLFFLGFMSPLLLLIPELPIIHNFTDRRFGIGRDLHQVQTEIIGRCQSSVYWQDPHLVAVGVDYPNLPCANVPVDVYSVKAIGLTVSVKPF